MCSFLLCERKEGFNKMLKLFSRANFTWFSQFGESHPTSTFNPRYLFAVVAVLLYCGVECSFASYGKSEFSRSAFDFNYGVRKSLESSHIPILSDRVKSFQFRKDSTSESGSGLVKSGFSVCCIGQMKPYP